MTVRLLPGGYTVAAHCPTCQAVTSFEYKQAVHHPTSFRPSNGYQFTRLMYILSQCAGCQRGGFAAVYDNGGSQITYLREFFPYSIDVVQLPVGVPADIQAEFREAEKCQGMGLHRAGSALFRSVLEKTLKANGYTKGNDPTLRDLQKRIDAAAADGVITAARQQKAHNDIRALGNDVLHDDWREVGADEVEDAHRYMQRILEDLYDDRPTVEGILRAKGKLSPAEPPAAPVGLPAGS